jgi:hypothetical protein
MEHSGAAVVTLWWGCPGGWGLCNISGPEAQQCYMLKQQKQHRAANTTVHIHTIRSPSAAQSAIHTLFHHHLVWMWRRLQVSAWVVVNVVLEPEKAR